MAKRANAARGGRSGSNGAGNGSNGNGSHRLFDDVMALASTLIRSRKESGVDKLLTLAASTRDFSGSLSDMPNLREQAAAAANSLEGLANYVLHTEIDEMVDDAGVFARKHPVITVAVSVGAGIAATSYFRNASGPFTASGRSQRRTTSTNRRARPQTRNKSDDRPSTSG